MNITTHRGIISIESNRVIWKEKGETCWIEPFSANGIRFRSTKSGSMPQEDWNLLPQETPSCKIETGEEYISLSNGKSVALLYFDGSVSYYNTKGEELLSEYWIDNRKVCINIREARCYHHLQGDVFNTELYFKSDPNELFYGLGQIPNGQFIQKGSTIKLAHFNTQAVIPFLYSTKNYGFLWNSPSIGEVQLVNNHTKWESKASPLIDYIIFAGDSVDEIVCHYSGITGKSPLIPDFATGFWQCKLRYRTQDELMDVAREYYRRGYPVSVIVIDFFHWPHQGEWKFDERFWPDPKKMVEELTEMGMTLMISIWPTVEKRSENFAQMTKEGLLLRAERGCDVFFLGGEVTYLDALNPEARNFVWGKIKKHYVDPYGIHMFWLDEAEPEINPYDYDNVRYALGNGLEVSSLYPYYYAQMIYDGMKEMGREDIISLVRCVWIGSQKFGTVLWSGDIEPTFEVLANQVKIGQSVGLCGIPWWTSDIGGFNGGDITDSDYCELVVRWFQFGAFSPIFRLHGDRLPRLKPLENAIFGNSGASNEVWSYGEENEIILVSYIRMRERLRPYIKAQFDIASHTGRPLMRPLFYDFSDDKNTYTIDDQYMFGPEILVAPVLSLGQRTRSVYLPAGNTWVHVWTEDTFDGGQWVEVDAPLDQIPLFVQEGSTLPFFSE